MRLYSTDESARQGEPSVLAIMETLIAMGATLWIAIYFETLVHIFVSAAVAPLLLLRTDRSCVRALWWYESALGDRTTNRFLHVLVLSHPLRVIGVRIVSTVLECVFNFKGVIGAIPRNFHANTKAIDFRVAPQWLPLPDHSSHEQLPSWTKYASVYSHARALIVECRTAWTHIGYLNASMALPLIGIMFLLFLIPAIAYRWSIKSTAVIWWPLIWAARPYRNGGRTWQQQLGITSALRVPLDTGPSISR